MEINEIINELKVYVCENNKEDKSIFKTFQKEFLTGFIGAMLNECKNDNYEAYIYIKNKDSIVSPLLLKKYSNVVDATNYYNELLYLIKDNSEDIIINKCKSI